MSVGGKIAFIVRKKTSDYPVCVEALRALEVPWGFSVELVTVEAGESIAADRQMGMHRCCADYKIYLEDNAVILDEKLLSKIIDVFQNNKHIGLIGVAGTNIVPTSGVSIHSPKLLGEIYDDYSRKVVGNTFTGNCQTVKAVIGFVMATQYDLDWPVFFDGNVFYDTAYSLEYQRQGYSCAVLNMSYPLVWKGSLVITANRQEQDLFLDQYSSDLYPLVSVIIPSYQRPHYLEEAINSVLNQTYRNLDVFVSDRSYDKDSEIMVKDKFSSESRLHYVHNPQFNRKEFYDYNDAYDNPKAEYVNWLMDDDLFAQEKIARMIDVYRKFPNVSLVTSYRKCIDSKGDILPDLPYTAPLSPNSFRAPGKAFAKIMLLNQMNIIGELSTCLIKKEYLHDGRIGCFKSEILNALSDVTTWIHMCSCGDVVYLNEPLSYFRTHDGQDQYNPRAMILCVIYWALLLDYDQKYTDFLENKEDKNVAMKKWLKIAATAAIEVKAGVDDLEYGIFKKIFSHVAQAFAGEKELDLGIYYK